LPRLLAETLQKGNRMRQQLTFFEIVLLLILGIGAVIVAGAVLGIDVVHGVRGWIETVGNQL